jgi:hypothetical protein
MDNRNTAALPQGKNHVWWSVPAVAAYFGTATAAAAAMSNRWIVATLTLAILCAILGAYLTDVHRKYRLYKPYKKIEKQLRNLSHHTLEYVIRLRQAPDFECDMLGAIATKNILTDASNMFTVLTNVQCTASLMLPVHPEGAKLGNERMLQTVQYCHNVCAERERSTGCGIAIGKGAPGHAFASGEVVTWRDTDPNFHSLRLDHKKYYRSGMCIPLKSGFEYIGLVNIDCCAENVFSEKMHRTLGALVGDSISYVIVTLELRKSGAAHTRKDTAAAR